LKRLRKLFKPSPYKIAIAIGFVFFVFHLFNKDHLDTVPVIGRVENILHDVKFKERGIRKPSGDVVVAAVDERAIATIGLWPFKRGDVARLVDKLTALGAKAIVFDVAYIDASSEGQFAAAQRLQRRFDQLSLTNPEAVDTFTKLSLAKTDAAAALSAAGAIDAARDVKSRLEPLAASLDDALKMLEKYRTLNGDFATALAQEAGGASGDDALGEAVHKSPAVVLGSLLLKPSEAKDVGAEMLTKELANVAHMSLNTPTPEPDLDSPEQEFAKEGAEIHGVRFESYGGARSAIEPLIRPNADKSRPMISFFNTMPDTDGVIRREPLVLQVVTTGAAAPTLLPQIDLGGMLRYYDSSPGTTRLWANGSDANQLEWVAILKNSAKGLQDTPKIKDFKVIPVDSQGRLLLNYYGPDKTFRNISLADVWNGTTKRSEVEGRVVLFGVTATATFDQRVTPYDAFSPGVEIHATAMENIIHDDFLRRPWWATPFESAIIIAIALVAGLLLSRISVTLGAMVTVLIAIVYHLVDSLLLFRSGISVFSAFPIAEVGFIYVSQTIYRYVVVDAGKRHLRDAFGLYLQPSVIDEMLKQPELPKLGGEKKTLSVMFSDIRGFTTISEKLTPEQLAKLINEYLTPMTSLVFEHGGTLDKYIGDALMAIFGAPVDQPDHALRCARTAVHMMRELAKLQERWRMEGNNYPPIDIGIGINSGPMVVGNMGGNQRFDYTVLGDNVNLASRLEGTNKEYRSHIIISEATYVLCNGQVAARELGAVRVKGKKEPVKIFELLDDKPPAGEIGQVIEIFNSGIAKFRTQQWEAARQEFRKVLEIWPNDGPPHAYIDFCNDMEKEPPGTDWDGVYTMTHK
jgi:class 3 adenylate cyclase/CHASE2 domain-containing sensor protein